ncbi:MAG: hypothetical protein J6V78_01075 [Clostridia bacterium]|nr:hypothetical protein [Clostridia bacterium]
MKIRLKDLNTGYALEKRVKKLSPKQRAISIIALTLVSVFLITFLFSAIGVLPLDAISARISTGLFGGGKNYPFTIESDDVVNMGVIGENLLVLTDKAVSVYDTNGNLTFSEKHTFSRPAFSVNENKGVVFDRNGTGYILITDKQKVSSGNTAGVIITAEYGKNGNYAFSLRGEKSTSVLAVFDKQGEVRFQWNCAYEHIASITLSDDGKFAGVATLNAENGAIYTVVHFFGFEYSSALNTQKLPDVAVLDLEFTNSTTLTAFSDTGIYQIKKNGDEYKEVTKYFSSEFISVASNEKGDYSVCLAKYGSANVFEILVFSASGRLKETIPLDYKVNSMCMSDKYIFALAENCIMVYNLRGRNVGTTNIIGKLYGVYPTDKYCFIHSLGCVSRCYSFGNNELELGFTI